MFELEQVYDETLSHYNDYEKAFEADLKQYQSRMYPSENAEILQLSVFSELMSFTEIKVSAKRRLNR